jgi:hypothetical protein
MESLLGFDLSQQNVDKALDAVADQVLLGPRGALAGNYERSGLKQKSGLLFKGITTRGAPGNYVRKMGRSVTVGIDPNSVRYFRWAVGGRGPVVAKPGKMLRFEIDGKVFYRKKVGPAPARPVYYLNAEADAEAEQVAMGVLVGV